MSLTYVKQWRILPNKRIAGKTAEGKSIYTPQYVSVLTLHNGDILITTDHPEQFMLTVGEHWEGAMDESTKVS